jgi:hypothetical protein
MAMDGSDTSIRTEAPPADELLAPDKQRVAN